MVDTLGLNARSLQAFIKYHEQPQHSEGLTRSALEEATYQGIDGPWYDKRSLGEIESLKELEDQLEREVLEGCAKNVVDKLSTLVRMLYSEVPKLNSKINEERRRIHNSKDPENVASLRKASLPKELADQQKALRSEYAKVLTQLGQAEEAVILVRSKLASRNAENGRMGAVPSVEAIKKTINKLIEITKDKNNEISLLEVQLRKVGLSDSTSRPTSSSSHQATTPLRRSRAAQARNESPFATPPITKSKMSLMELNRVALTPERSTESPSNGYGLFYTPQGSPTSGPKNLSRIADMVDDDLDRLKEVAKRRKDVAGSLQVALANRGVKRTSVA